MGSTRFTFGDCDEEAEEFELVAPSFHYKAFKSKSSKKCIWYDDWGDLYETDCGQDDRQSYSFDLGTNELIAEGGGKEKECLRADRIWPKLHPCDGSDEQFMEWSGGVIKNTPSNQCLKLFPSPSTRFTFGDCDEEAEEFELVAPSFHYKAFRSKSSKKCIWYDDWGDLYETDCGQDDRQSYSFDLGTNELIAEGGAKIKEKEC